MERSVFVRGVGSGWCHRKSRVAIRDGVRGIVLAGSHSWGECALERMVSRPLLPIGTRPLICHILDWFSAEGVGECSICANSETSLYQRCLRDGECLGIRLEYAEDVMPRGPAGCARDAAMRSGGHTFVVVEGAGIPRVDLSELLAAHERADAALTVVVEPATGSRGDRGAAFEPVGVYVFSAAALQTVPELGYQDIKECLIPSLYRAGQKIVTLRASADGPPRVADGVSYLAANMWATRRMAAEGSCLAGHRRVGEAWIHNTADVHATARFVGPVWVGPRTVIGANVMVVGPTTVGADGHVHADAVISRSAVWDACVVQQGAVVDQCILTVEAIVERELVIRNTVCTSSRYPGRRVIEWLASRCWLADDRDHAFYAGHGPARMLAAS